MSLDADLCTDGLQGLTSAQQTAFLDSLLTSSIVEYGSNAAFGTPTGGAPIPEPCTLVLLGTGLLGAGLLGRRKKKGK